MKIEATKVVEFLDQVKALVEGISYSIQCGDDGFEECVRDQVEGIGKVIEVFKLQRLTPITTIEPAAKRYGKIYDALLNKENRTSGENMELYKSELYYHLKRFIRNAKNVDWDSVHNNELMNHIEFVIPDNSVYKRLIYSNEFFHVSIAVIGEVADEIIEQRVKAPQTKLF